MRNGRRNGEQNEMKIYLSAYRENEKNVYYRTPAQIETLGDLRKATERDHIAPQMKDNYRNKDNFLQGDCIILDCDNTHSPNAEDWVTPDDVADAFPDVEFYFIHSRNHMKEKVKTNKAGETTRYEPRPKFHCYFPLSKTYTNAAEYEAIQLKAAGLFPYFDLGAAKPSQFYYGVTQPTGGEESGTIFLDEFIKQQDTGTIKQAIADFVGRVKDGTYTLTEPEAVEKGLTRLCVYIGMPPVRITEEPEPAAAPTASGTDPAAPAADAPQYDDMGLEIGRMEQQRSLQWLRDWVAKHDIQTGKEYKINSREHPEGICICVSCPWESTHSMQGAENESVIIVDLGGRLSYLCRHGHCAGRSWKDYRAYYEQRDAALDFAEVEAAVNEAREARAEDAAAGAPAADPGEPPQPEGLLTYSAAVDVLQNADDKVLKIENFPRFSEAAKIKLHDSVVVAADTGVGKSSLALNFIHDLNAEYPVLYFNLEMDLLTVLRRLVAIESGISLDTIENYKNSARTATAVNNTLQKITSKKPLQVIQFKNKLQDIGGIIARATQGREEPTIVVIDHSLLVRAAQHTTSRYERFTEISETLRGYALKYNIILFVLLQQNRDGKKDEDAKPRNDSLKESGSWENDSTHIVFLWWDRKISRKKLLMTKNRNGRTGEFILNYSAQTQRYSESDTQEVEVKPQPVGRREKQRQQLQDAFDLAFLNTQGKPTLEAMADAAQVRVATIKGWLKEFGGCTIDGVRYDPAGMNEAVDLDGFIQLPPTDETPFDTVNTDPDTGEELPPPMPAKKKR